MLSIKNSKISKENFALISIIFAYTVWGIQSLYWKLLQGVPLIQLLAHRIIWSSVLLLIVIIRTGRLKELIKVLKLPKKLFYVFMCAIAIGLNWLLNIYAAYSNQVIEASLGHYVTPIVTICLGVFILKEKIKPYEIAALITAFIGVSIMTISLGRIPMIAVLLIGTFAIYTFIKKIISIDTIIGITSEMLILSPIALVYIIYMEVTGNGVVTTSSFVDILLIISTGIFSAVPLLMFSYGVKLINFSKIGYMQYLAPSLSLIIGIFIFKESFTKIHLICFGFIWTAIAIVLIYPRLTKFKRMKRKDIASTTNVK